MIPEILSLINFVLINFALINFTLINFALIISPHANMADTMSTTSSLTTCLLP